MKTVEYRVRPVTRYIVTRFEAEVLADGRSGACGSSTKGEFDNWDTAYAVGYALAKQEHDQLGYPICDERIKYPQFLSPAELAAVLCNNEKSELAQSG